MWRVNLHFLTLFPFHLHFLILSPFSLHFLILSPFARSQDARMQQVVQPWCAPIKVLGHRHGCPYQRWSTVYLSPLAMMVMDWWT